MEALNARRKVHGDEACARIVLVRSQPSETFQRGFATSGARIKGEGRKGGLIYARFRGSVMSKETMESVKK